MASKNDKPASEPMDALEMEPVIADLSEAADMAAMEPSTPKAGTPEPDRFIQQTDPQGRNRRRWKRFTVEGAVVMVPQTSLWGLGKTSYVTLGPIKNIGMKGLAVHYSGKGEKLLAKADTLSVMFPGEGIIVDKIPFRVVSNFKIADLPGDKEVRSLCVAFDRLLPMQKLQMELFIDAYGNELMDK
ncbi:MAG: hypothetical protein ACOZBW_03230 [Thermodesulfobacteriota bacterium]